MAIPAERAVVQPSPSASWVGAALPAWLALPAPAHTDNPADIGLAVMEYAGLSSAAGSAAVDVSATASGTTGGSGATVSSGATAATTAAHELAVGAYVD